MARDPRAPAPRYVRTVNHVKPDSSGNVDVAGGVGGDHGGLTGLGDDDHPQYLTSAEGNAAYEASGAVATHAGLADPHTGYQKESEKSAASGYASLDGSTKVPIAELPTGSTSSTVPLGSHVHAIPTITRRVAGDTASSSATWVAVDTGLDITLNAEAGDTIQVGASGLWSNQAVHGRLDVHIMVGGSAFRSVASRTTPVSNSEFGNPAWFGASGQFDNFGGEFPYVVQSSDLSAGTITLRLVRRNDAAVSRTIFASLATSPLHFWAYNRNRA